MFDRLIEKLKSAPKKIVFTEGHDPRILEAAARLKKDSFLTPILIGNVDEVKAAAAKGNFDIEGLLADVNKKVNEYKADPAYSGLELCEWIEGENGLPTLDLTGESDTASTLSEGNRWIVAAVGAAAVIAVAALVIVKKKKKPALADGTDNTDEE